MLNNKSNLLLPSSPDTRISVLPYKARKEVSVHFPGKQILHFGFAEQNYVLNMKHVSRGDSVYWRLNLAEIWNHPTLQFVISLPVYTSHSKLCRAMVNLGSFLGVLT